MNHDWVELVSLLVAMVWRYFPIIWLWYSVTIIAMNAISAHTFPLCMLAVCPLP